MVRGAGGGVEPLFRAQGHGGHAAGAAADRYLRAVTVSYYQLLSVTAGAAADRYLLAVTVSYYQLLQVLLPTDMNQDAHSSS